MPARPFLRTSSKCHLVPSSVYDTNPPEGRGCPQHVVIGFHLSQERKHGLDACDSPRSVLEASAHSEQSRSPRSPRSVLGCLISGKESHRPPKEGVGLGVVAAIRAEEARVLKSPPEVAMKSKPIVISAQNGKMDVHSQTLHGGGLLEEARAFYSEVMRVDDMESYDVDDDPMTGMREPIFCAASPFDSACCSLEKSTSDFLSVCFLCKCHLAHGKDVYMYKGDKAFCSSECRYQQIVIDEYKERQLATANWCVGASTQDNSKIPAQAAAAN